MCATRQNDLLYPLFVCARPDLGFFQIRFYVDAAWRVVSVDDRVPVKKSGASIFAHCKNEDEYWVALVEKLRTKRKGKKKKKKKKKIIFYFFNFSSFQGPLRN